MGDPQDYDNNDSFIKNFIVDLTDSNTFWFIAGVLVATVINLITWMT